MDDKRKTRDYDLSFDEFVEVIGAIREIPRIYKSIEKMESNIQRLTQDQGKQLTEVSTQYETLKYRVDQIEKAAKESPYIEYPGSKGGITQKDLVNIIVKGITVVGVFASIIYAVVQGLYGK